MRDHSKTADRCWSLIILLVLLQSTTTTAQQQCAQRSCYPATGDLLIGRENKLYGSSTCGLKQAEQYCIVGFLKEQKKCFTCDSRNASDRLPNGYKTSHRLKYMVSDKVEDKLKTWWQAQNGKENVYIQLDLEAEFHFTHLIMTFKTFRPAGMIVEKSSDYGRTWSIYRYFAADCSRTFPGIKRGPQRKINDVICEEKYSGIEPSTQGEVVMKVLDPLLATKNPYSFQVQKLLKLTNLRVNFTKLHTLGDDALSDGPDVQKKYYYALYEMIVRGSCSCYGHAQECIPANGAPNNPNMVHGQCNCTHNTRGRNCELCKPGYNDLPWAPALDRQINECKKCNCHFHTNICHFDPAVYKATGNASGGVCDDCQHNTTGRQCDLCKPLFYRDPFKDLADPKVCLPCDCDPSGSTGGGECETITDPVNGTLAGRCICKRHVRGRRCDLCRDGYYNLQETNINGCQSCNCDGRGTVSVSKCDTQTGKCNCKRFVQGTTCNQCYPKYWGLGSSIDGCQPCACDVGGAYNDKCDEIAGSCECRPNIIGRRCNMPRPGYFSALADQIKFEAEDAVPSPGTIFKEINEIPPSDSRKQKSWSGDGFARVKAGSKFDFTMVRVPHSGNYDMVVRYRIEGLGGWNGVKATVKRTDGRPLSGGPCVTSGSEKVLKTTLLSYDDNAKMTEPICLQKNVVYNVGIEIPDGLIAGETVLIDSVVFIPRSDSISILKGDLGERNRRLYDKTCKKYYYSAGRRNADIPKECQKLQFSISAVLNVGALACRCDRIGTQSNGTSDTLTCANAGGQCPCKPNVIGRTCDRCAPGAFGFSSQGCKACKCDTVGSRSDFCDLTTGQCSCIANVVGRQCNQCPANHFGFPACKKCQCNGHSTSCDPKTGVCLNCQHNTAGNNCEECSAGFYGDATKGTDKDCTKCQCPGGSTGNQFSKTCFLDNRKKPATLVCDACQQGYTGRQCEKCADGYFGNPLVPNGKCQKCNCNGNINAKAAGKCDHVTGECFSCQFNTTGFYCETCQKGFFGNALNRTCKECVCNSNGTDQSSKGVCDPSSGQCTCLKNVAGIQCDKCEPGYWNLASGKGCQSCKCDKEGSLEAQCNQLDGQCRCRTGFGGKMCSECEDNFWGNPKTTGCKACLCNPTGSKSLQCDRKTGKCECRPGVTGIRCDMCDARTTGVMPRCDKCHACYDQWDDIISEQERNLTNYVAGSNITSPGAIYDFELQNLKNMLKKVEKILANRSLNAKDVNKFRKELDIFRRNLTSISARSAAVFKSLANTTDRDMKANEELDRLSKYGTDLVAKGQQLRNNMTDIAYGDVAYAYNVTLESDKRSRKAQETIKNAVKALNESTDNKNKMMNEVVNANPRFLDLHFSNQGLLGNLTSKLSDLERILNKTNMMLCGGEGSCGGCTHNGCGMCGGANCTGVKNLAKVALMRAKRAEEAMRNKEVNAKKLMEEARDSEAAVIAALNKAKMAFDDAKIAKMLGESVAKNITILIKDIMDFLNVSYHHPEESEVLADMTLALNISLTPSEITSLAMKINETVRNLTNVDAILKAAEGDLFNAMELKRQALLAKAFANNVSSAAQNVIATIVLTIEKQLKIARVVNDTRDQYNFYANQLKKTNIKLRKAMMNSKLKSEVGRDPDLQDASAKLNKTLEMAKMDTMSMNATATMVAKQNDENKMNLGGAVAATAKATAATDKLKPTAALLQPKYAEANDKIKKRSDELNDARRRAMKLIKDAKSLHLKTLFKLSKLNEMKTEYVKREARVKDLADELAKLEARIIVLLEQMRKITGCHRTCNPGIAIFCEGIATAATQK